MNNWQIHSLFKDIAEKFPASTAVKTTSRHVTYGELNASVNRIARVLIEKGVGGQEFIGLHFNALIEYVATLLGVLKAGAVFMSLNLTLDKWA